MTDAQPGPTKRHFHPIGDYAIMDSVILPLAIIFMLGIANFALHRAVLESGHPLLGQMPGFVQSLGGRLTYLAEFLVLLAAMALAANGWPGLVWAYGLYSALNAVSAWLMLSGRI
ncbi:hypothetical protein [uncultured Erythrobacter sp.]|uniref:hypothetical protein n=1 Tax=uncultured Erythrobacter sp. TaxID=263913 RepID=UPI002616E127|nr:hypothetical protein [uncultured Erythrobacter sp.]